MIAAFGCARRALGVELDPGTSQWDIEKRAAQVSLDARTRALRCFYRALERRSVRDSENERLDVLGAIVALMPDAQDLFAHTLARTDDGSWFEVHFSLFIALRFVLVSESIPGSAAFFDAIPGIITRYLLSAKSETAIAAWEAGGSMVDICRLDIASAHLANAAANARYVAGRLGALHGIQHALARLEARSESTDELMRFVKRLSRRDASRRVRRSAKRILSGNRCLETPRAWYERELGLRSDSPRQVPPGSS